MVIGIFNADTENNSSPQFLEILCYVLLRSVLYDKFYQLQVACTAFVISAIGISQQCHSRSEMNPFSFCCPVKSFCKVSMIFAAEPDNCSFRNIQSCSLC